MDKLPEIKSYNLGNENTEDNTGDRLPPVKLHIKYYFNYIVPEFHKNELIYMDGIIPLEHEIIKELLMVHHRKMETETDDYKNMVKITNYTKEILNFK